MKILTAPIKLAFLITTAISMTSENLFQHRYIIQFKDANSDFTAYGCELTVFSERVARATLHTLFYIETDLI